MKNIKVVPDSRFKTIKLLLERKQIKSFDQIFWYIPKTIVAGRLGVKTNRFDAFIENPELLRVEQVNKLAGFFKITRQAMMDLVWFKRPKPIVQVNHGDGARTNEKKRNLGRKNLAKGPTTIRKGKVVNCAAIRSYI